MLDNRPYCFKQTVFVRTKGVFGLLKLKLVNEFKEIPRRRSHSHGLHRILDELHPGVALILGAGQDLHHLWLGDASRDEEQAAFFVSNLPHNQLLERDDGGALVLGAEAGRGLMEARREEEKNKDQSGRVKEEEEGKTDV